MNKKVAGYSKTEHFLLRQWERKVSDYLLLLALNRLKKTGKKFFMVVPRNFIKKYLNEETLELFVLIKNGKLITCFYNTIASQMKKDNRNEYIIVS